MSEADGILYNYLFYLKTYPLVNVKTFNLGATSQDPLKHCSIIGDKISGIGFSITLALVRI